MSFHASSAMKLLRIYRLFTVCGVSCPPRLPPPPPPRPPSVIVFGISRHIARAHVFVCGMRTDVREGDASSRASGKRSREGEK
eukprot:741932-Hanusia_phi.AAC.3